MNLELLNAYWLWFFGAGVTIRSLYAIKNRTDILRWVIGWFFALAIVAKIYKNNSPTSEQIIFSTFLAFGFAVAILLYKNILPTIKEHSLLLITLIFFYCLFRHQSLLGDFQLPLIVLTFLPSLAVIILSFINLILPAYLQLFFYCWFISLNIFFIYFYLFSNEISLWNYSSLSFSSPLDAFLTGFTAFSLTANLGFIYLLFPLKSKSESAKEATKRWKDYAELLISKHDDSQMSRNLAISIIGISGIILIANYLFGLISDEILIPVYLFSSQIFLPGTKQLPASDTKHIQVLGNS